MSRAVAHPPRQDDLTAHQGSSPGHVGREVEVGSRDLSWTRPIDTNKAHRYPISVVRETGLEPARPRAHQDRNPPGHVLSCLSRTTKSR
jgi:hypothetical protein